jgi:copper chaperone NosL
MRPLVLFFVLLTAAGCAGQADGPPGIVVDSSACSHCGMLISERAYAAAYRAAGADARVFDDIGCLIAAARKDTSSDLRFWFHDARDSAWIDGRTATFVASSEIRTPMGGGIVAYRDPEAAGEAARTHRGEVVRTLADLLARTGGRP